MPRGLALPTVALPLGGQPISFFVRYFRSDGTILALYKIVSIGIVVLAFIISLPSKKDKFAKNLFQFKWMFMNNSDSLIV